MMMGHCGGGWAHWVWMAETLLLWGLVITGVVLLVRYLFSLGSASASVASGVPREEGLLGERYARGELDDDEYRRRMTVLRQHR